jgi:hypothetical protein
MTGTPETERQRKTRKLVETLEAMQVLCKQLDNHAGELLQALREETKG